MPTDLPVKASTFRRVGLLLVLRKTIALQLQAHTCERGDSVFPWCPRSDMAVYSGTLAACYTPKGMVIYSYRKGKQPKNGGKHNGSIRNRKGKSNGKQNGLERKNGWTIVNKVDRRREKNQKRSSN